ncbi:MAG TPA: hypothetical protein VFU60_15355 [Ktedonobacterales bacterium]|jgi:hypothetical protein|nr:hypothetical protein [Ktedonobacterales bacterium]
MRATDQGYIIGRALWRWVAALAPGALIIALLVGLLLGFGPAHPAGLFDVGLALAIAFFALGEFIIITGFIRRPVLLATSDAGLLYYPVRSDPMAIPWARVAAIFVRERLVGQTMMRSLVFALRPLPGEDPNDPEALDHVSLPAHQLPLSAGRCLRLLAERHREQIALNNIAVFEQPQVEMGKLAGW